MEVTAPSRISRDPRGAPPHAQPRGATIGRGGASRAVTRGAGRGLARPRPSAPAWYPRAGGLACTPASWPRVCGVKKHTGNAPLGRTCMAENWGRSLHGRATIAPGQRPPRGLAGPTKGPGLPRPRGHASRPRGLPAETRFREAPVGRPQPHAAPHSELRLLARRGGVPRRSHSRSRHWSRDRT